MFMIDFNIKKLYYSISEVSKITEIEQYVLRFWENEFEQLKPQKNRAGNRIYTNKEIELILLIKELLRDKKYTIEGAKKIIEEFVKNKNNPQPKVREKAPAEEIQEIKPEETVPELNKEISQTLEKDLIELKAFLEVLKNKM